MSTINFNTSNQTLRQLLGNGVTYRVPPFQRDYSWEQDQWEELWLDIQATLNGSDSSHYMGYLVLQSSDQRDFEIIDGQQRLTTLSILALAVLAALDELVARGVQPDDNRRRAEQLRNTFIGYLDPVTLVARTKLTLNRNNDSFYRDKLAPLQPLPKRGLRASEHLLRNSFEWFRAAVARDFGESRDGAELARLLSDISDRLFFTVITVSDELNAFKVFETLNSRGVRLSPTDLLKNYLFAVVQRDGAHESDIAALERLWGGLVDQLGSESFPAFLRAHWNSRSKLVREAELFRTLRAGTPDRQSAFELMRRMESDAPIYSALSSPDGGFWPASQREPVRELRMFAVRQPWPLLMAAYRKLSEAGFSAVLKAVSIVSFRHNVIGNKATNEQERVYNELARKLESGELSDERGVIRGLGAVYVADANFRTDFETKVLRTRVHRNKTIARHLLFRIENHLSGSDFDPDSLQYSLEHILPESPGPGWEAFPEPDESVYRLGNLALLESNLNRDLGNRSFAEKREVYARSVFASTRRLAEENAAWDEARLAARQSWMARQATTLWRLPQLER